MKATQEKPFDIDKMTGETQDSFTLFIKWTDGCFKKIENVTDYGVLQANNKVFYYIKNGFKSFVPMKRVLYFGKADNWYQEDTEHKSSGSFKDICLGGNYW